MNRVADDQEQRTNGNGEPARTRINGASHSERESGEGNANHRMRATADSLIRIATKAFMQMNGVDYETAQQWIAGAAVPEAKNKKPPRKSPRVRR